MEERVIKFKDTTATKKVFSLTKRIRAVCGGTSGSKTVSIIVWCIDYGQTNKGEKISIVSESYPHLELGAIADFISIMKDRGYWKDSLWNGTKHTYTFETGTVLEFLSMDKLGKAHGPRRDVLFINEAPFIDYQIADQLITRTRKIVWLDWNPTNPDFWFYTEILGKRKDVDFITLTYLDNEALDPISLQEILAHKDNARWWRVYGEGKLGEIEGRIYVGWQVIDEIPHEARLERRWLDFGYTNDPTAIGDVYKYNGGYILDEQLYQKGLSNKQIADSLLNMKKCLTIADSAEPKSIDELRMYGLNVQPANKGRDSIVNGIQMVQDQQISVTRRSVNLLKEYRNYMWQIDKDGRTLNEPEEIWNHHMDGIRYAMSSLIPIIQREELIMNMPRFNRTPRKNPAR